MICPNCQTNLPDNFVACPNCGTQLRNYAPKQGNSNRGLLIAIIVLASLLVLMGLGFVIYHFTSSNKQEDVQPTEKVEVKLSNNSQTEQGLPATLNLRGTIGGDYGAAMNINGKSGTYNFMGFTRNITVDSYDPASGKLVVSGHDRSSGQYIGKFDGSLSGNGNSYTYSGRFTNYRGVSLNFSLSN